MAKHIEDEVVYYYDTHPTEEDLMGETALHRHLIEYLSQVRRDSSCRGRSKTS